MVRKTHAEFEKEASDYGIDVLSPYRGALKKIRLKHRKCGHIWVTVANNIISGHGCPACARKRTTAASRRKRGKRK